MSDVCVTPRCPPRIPMFNTGVGRYNNEVIADLLFAEFEPIGIAAYTCCCKYLCTGTYADEDEWRKTSRKNGIYFFRFTLDGMNYFNNKRHGVYAHYCDYDYLIHEWESEKKIVERWCNAIGLYEGDYTVEQPEQGKAVWVEFNKPYLLDADPTYYRELLGSDYESDGE